MPSERDPRVDPKSESEIRRMLAILVAMGGHGEGIIALQWVLGEYPPLPNSLPAELAAALREAVECLEFTSLPGNCHDRCAKFSRIRSVLERGRLVLGCWRKWAKTAEVIQQAEDAEPPKPSALSLDCPTPKPEEPHAD